MAENIINKDLISLFRGQPMFGQTTNQALSSYPSEKMLSGKFFSPDLDLAKNYAKNSSFPSVVKEMKVPSNVLDKAYNFKNRLQTLPSKTFEMINMNPKVVIANKNMLKNYKPSINIPATLSSNFSQGIGFLKNNAMKGLAYASSLPFQTALATLYPTPANASEVNMGPEDFAALNVSLDELNVNAPQFSFTDYLQGNYDLNQNIPSSKPSDAISRTNVQGMDLEMDSGAFINPNIQQSQNMFQRSGNAIQGGLGSMRDFAGKGMDLGKMAMSGIGNAIMPGLGFLMSNLKPEPLFRETLSNSRKENNTLQGLGLDGVGNFGGFTTDDLGRVVNTGNYITPENIMSGYNAGFDLAGSALGRIGTIQRAIDKGRFKDKFALDRANKKIDALKTAAVASAQAKRQAYQDKIDRAKNEAAANRARAKSISAGYGGHDDSPGATGPTAAGAGMGVGGGYASDYGFKKDGGMIGYRDGGLASMFVRRG